MQPVTPIARDLPPARVEPISAYLRQQQANYQAVQALHQQGLTLRSSAEQLQINVNTANKYGHLPAPPAKQHRTTLKLIGHEACFYQRWNDGERSPRPSVPNSSNAASRVGIRPSRTPSLNYAVPCRLNTQRPPRLHPPCA